jgi:hypothetical protein
VSYQCGGSAGPDHIGGTGGARGSSFTPRTAPTLSNIEVSTVKLSCTSDELDGFEAMDDAALTEVIRDALKKFRARDNEPAQDDLDNTTTRGVTGGPREGAKVAQDAAAATLRTYGLSESVIRESVRPHDTSAADRRAAERLIPGLGRLK